MARRIDPDGVRLPIKLDATSNGEYLPRPPSPHIAKALEAARSRADELARKLGQPRRQFLISLSGAATCLLALNKANAAAGKRGGAFEIDRIAALDADAAEAAIGKKEFIFDIQTHHFDPPDAFSEPTPWTRVVRQTASATGCDILPEHAFGHMTCTDSRAFIREIFLDSDTDAAVLSFVPTTEDSMPLSYEQASATRQIVDAMDGGKRLLLHGRIIPNLPGDLERMDSVREQWNIAAWKTYTQYGPDYSSGWWFDDDEFGKPFIEKVRASGVKTICVHKGLPLAFPLMGEDNLEYRFCRDIGPAAAHNPDISFIVYHSGYDGDLPEGSFEPHHPRSGTDSLIQSLIENEIPPNSNVYAELGSTWWQVMSDPDQAAHLLGKLLTYVGEDNVVWGTDCLFYGSPQDQIQAFRSFQISDEFQERFGYPKLTDRIRTKIFGLNALKAYDLSMEDLVQEAATDPVGRAKAAYIERRDPTFLTYGPKTRRDFFRLARSENH